MYSKDELLLLSVLGWLEEVLNTGDIRGVGDYSRDCREEAVSKLGFGSLDDFYEWRMNN